MTRYSGKIGFGTPVESVPGVWEDGIDEVNMKGSFLRQNANIIPGDSINDDVKFSNRLSLVHSSKVPHDYMKIKYAVVRGMKLKVTSVEVSHPRILLSLGGLWIEQN